MSKRVATVQISDRDPIGLEEDDVEHFTSDNDGNYYADDFELSKRKISKPRQRLRPEGKEPPSLGNLFAGLPRNPFLASNPASSNSTATVTSSSNSKDVFEQNMHDLNTCFVQSAQKLYEKNPIADFTKLFGQYTKHLASFSDLKPDDALLIPKMTPITPVAPVSQTKISTNLPIPAFSTIPAVTPLVPVTKINSTPIKNNSESSDDEDIVMIEKQPFSFPAPSQPAPQFTPIAVGEKKPLSFSPSPAVAEEKDKSGLSFSFSEKTAEEAKLKAIEKPVFVPPEIKKEEKAPQKIEKEPEPSAKLTFKAEVTPSVSSLTSSAVPDNSKLFGSELPKFSFGGSNSFSFGSSVSAAPETMSSLPFTTATISPETGSDVINSKSTVEAPKFSFSSGTATTVEAPKFSFGAETPKFSFGSSNLPPLPSFSINPTPASALSTGFSFTAPLAKVAESGDEGDEIPAEEAESFSLTRSNNDQLKTGAGEENETCQHEERCKIFMMDKNTSGWADLGVGIFKINRYNNETGKSRILCRAEGSGKIIMNSLVSVPGMDVTSLDGKKEVALLAIGPEGKPTKYLVRVKTLEQAQALKTALLSELDYVKKSKN